MADPKLERPTYVRLDKATRARLAEIAEADKRSVSYVVRVAVEQYINRRRPAEA